MAEELTATKAYSQIESFFGVENVFADMDEVPEIDIIKTPSPGLDRIIGVGGWPRGRLIQLAGKESSGKTLLGLQTMAYWQSLDPENCAAFLDAEYTYDQVWAASLGVDNDRVFLVKTNEAAKLFTGLVGKIKVNKKTKKTTKIAGLFDMISAGQIITYKSASGKKCTFNLGKLGVIVLDSIAALQTPTELSSEVGKQNMALMARFLSVELKKLTPGLAKSNVVMLAINQVRVKVGQTFGNPESTSGGRALKHACSLMVELGQMSGEGSVLKDENDEDVGRRIKVKITKNKVAAPFKKSEYFVKFNEGVIEKEKELLEAGLISGGITKPKASGRTYMIGEMKVTSKEEAHAYIKNNYDLVENLVRGAYLSNVEPPSSDEDEPDEVVISDLFEE